MDSGNSSGSLQSSSGGDDEYDSRAESSFPASFMISNNHSHNHHVGLGLAPFTTTTTNTNNFANSHMVEQQHDHHNNNNNTHVLFDPLSNYLDPMQQRSSLLNLDMMWSSSKPPRSEPHLGSPPTNPSQLQQQQQQQSHSHAHALLSSAGQTARDNSGASFHALPADSQQQHDVGGSRGMLSVSVSGSAANNNTSTSNDHQPQSRNNNVGVGVRNPKKRSRASRRAPTTVLTTDTTNFRAMVQEFTGIPAQPFPSASSPFPRTRFDLFASAPPSSTTNVRSTLLDPSSLPPYLLRPFAHKLHHHLPPFPPPPSSNPMLETLLPSNNNSTNNDSTTSIADLLKHHPLNFSNHPIPNFQQQPPKYHPLGNSNPPSSVVASRAQPSLEIPPPSSGESHLKVGVFEELGGMSGGGLHHENQLSNNASTTEWAQRTSGTITNDDHEQGGGDQGTLAAATLNYSTNVADRTAAARSEGMVESWINCSSDN